MKIILALTSPLVPEYKMAADRLAQDGASASTNLVKMISKCHTSLILMRVHVISHSSTYNRTHVRFINNMQQHTIQITGDRKYTI